MDPFPPLRGLVECVVLVALHQRSQNDPFGDLRAVNPRRRRQRDLGISVDGVMDDVVGPGSLGFPSTFFQPRSALGTCTYLIPRSGCSFCILSRIHFGSNQGKTHRRKSPFLEFNIGLLGPPPTA